MKTNKISDSNHLIRKRVNALLEESVINSYVTVCAGAGCGKTRAVYDCVQRQERPVFWFQLGECDNSVGRFWEDYINAILRYDTRLVDRYKEIGFPDTEEKMQLFLKIRYEALLKRPYIMVLDDFHLLSDSSVLGFIETLVNNMPPDSTKVLICRDLPDLNIESLQIKGSIAEIYEADLNFTQSEIAEYFAKHELTLDSQTVREIYEDTKGWAFAVNLVTRSLKRVPNYFGYVKTTLKQNIYKLIEAENWTHVSEPLKRFLVRLSLIDHLPATLVESILSAGDADLLAELNRQNDYIRFDRYGGAYLVHHLYLDFLQSKQDSLTDEEKYETYKAAADWCRQHQFKVDALVYYEMIGDYDSINATLYHTREHMPGNLSLFAAEVFKRAPEEVFEKVSFLAAAHLGILFRLCRWNEFAQYSETYEKKLSSLPESEFRNDTLGGVYYYQGCMRFLMSTSDNKYDFNLYFSKAEDCLAKSPVKHDFFAALGSWVSAVGDSAAGAPQKFAEAMAQMALKHPLCFNSLSGLDALCRGEFKFYQNDLRGAKILLIEALECAREREHFDIVQRALFYIMRISVMQGDSTRAEQILLDLEALMNETENSQRSIIHDIAISWYHCVIRRFDEMPRWLKDDFVPYNHAYHIENFGNQIKARYYYLNRNYMPLLSYIGEMRKRESVLYGRIEMLALEACVHYQMKNKQAAWDSLKSAYEAASPNGIITPFIELGKDMRTLAMAALRKQPNGSEIDIGIPRPWLESVRHKAALYAKTQSLFISSNKQYDSNKPLSARESAVMNDLYSGLSQPEIAKKHSLSVNTVKMVTKNIYDKLHVHKISDLIRVVAEQGLV
jgi:LuxR family maltose regulon positive regulatory protein